MRAIVIGCGKLGYRIAETLSEANYNVIVIDRDSAVVNKANETLDVMALKYNGLVGQTLKQLGVNTNDLVIATTESDEGNILACISAKEAGVGKTIARIRNPEYSHDIVVSKEKFSIDYIINPEKSTANEIMNILKGSPGGQLGDYANGSVRMLEIPIEENNPYLHKKIADIDRVGDFLVAAISRNGQLIIPSGNNEIKFGDNIFMIGNKNDILGFCDTLGRKCKKIRSVMILGGGRISHYLAENILSSGMSVKIIEKDFDKCRELAESLPGAMIINGDGSDLDLLKSENIGAMDAFISLTGMDEENVIIALLAKKLGVSKVISKVSRTNYISLVETMGIDAAITPSIISAGEIMKIVLGDKVVSISWLLGGQAEVMEFITHSKCTVLDIPLKKLNFPNGAIISSIVRNDRVIIPHGDDVIKENDRVVVLSEHASVEKIRNMFKVKGR